MIQFHFSEVVILNIDFSDNLKIKNFVCERIIDKVVFTEYN